jgi:hypothetical protein
MRDRRLVRFLLGALLYVGLSAVWIYGVLDRGTLERGGAWGWALLGVIAVLHVAFGFGIDEWPAVVLPVVVLILAIPAGYPESQFSEPGPVWFGQLVIGQFEMALIAAGLGLKALVRSRGAAARSS